jgi:hypothetical protein
MLFGCAEVQVHSSVQFSCTASWFSCGSGGAYTTCRDTSLGCAYPYNSRNHINYAGDYFVGIDERSCGDNCRWICICGNNPNNPYDATCPDLTYSCNLNYNAPIVDVGPGAAGTCDAPINGPQCCCYDNIRRFLDLTKASFTQMGLPLSTGIAAIVFEPILGV